jgi:competence ComEA-like helix-hairpin-helix protein
MSWLRSLWDRVNKLAQQFYTPRELRALVIFIGIGLAVVLYRSGRRMYYEYFPKQRDSALVRQQHEQDSLYFALSAEANRKDSLFFALPEDSLIPPRIRAQMAHHTKEDDLRLGSISLNRGSKDDLVKLPGVGDKSAALIISYRKERGGFRSLEEIMAIPGFGQKKFERMKRFLKLD